MSEIRVTDIKGETGLDAVNFSKGINISSGIVTATSFSGSGASLTGLTAGITMADQWRLATDRNLSATTETIDANWERVDNSSWGQIGSGMTQSSGIFTFPSTGIYLITFNVTMYSISQTQRYSGALIGTTTDNSGYVTVATTYFNGGINSGSGVYMFGEAKFQLDVTDTTQRKVRFQVQAASAAAAYVAANTNESITYATFIRLGDT